MSMGSAAVSDPTSGPSQERFVDPVAERSYVAALTLRARLQADVALNGEKASGGLLRAANRALEKYDNSHLAWLGECLGLDDDEIAILQIATAAALEPGLDGRLSKLNGQLQWPYLTSAAIARMMGESIPRVPRSGALFRWKLLEEESVGAADPNSVAADPFVVAAVTGDPEWDAHISGRMSQIPEVSCLNDWPVQETAHKLQRAWGTVPVRLLVTGGEGSGRRSFCHLVAKSLGHSAVFADTSGLTQEEFDEFYLRANRQALVLGHALIWSPDFATRRLPIVPGVFPLQFVLGDYNETLPAARGMIDEKVEMKPPGRAERAVLWQQFLPSFRSWSEDDQRAIVDGYKLQIGEIISVAGREVETVEEARECCRAATRGRLGEYVDLVDCTFTREDIVLPPRVEKVIDELIQEASHRAQFWERPEAQRLFPRGRGLVGLFAGGPGTGKTMAAQVIAHELGLDLLRVDLASIVSKYIGETAKNISKIFAQVREMNALLFFDEADSLFATRTDVSDSHDRHANADTNYLLQRLEEFEGVALLATNKKSNLDPAFLRRLRTVVEFPSPGKVERVAMFERMLAELAPECGKVLRTRAAAALGDNLELTGAQIKLSVLGATFQAEASGGEMTLEHMFSAVERELRKEGKFLSDNDRQRVLKRIRRVVR